MRLALAILLATARLAAADGRDVAYAIVIGNNSPPGVGTQERLAPLRYADDDAVRYYELFSRFAETRLFVVLDTESQRRYPGLGAHADVPTLENLKRAVAELAAEMARDRAHGDRPVLYFAFSGHGARDEHGQAFLALLDGPLTQKTLYDDILGKLPTTVTHVIVDACNAGGVLGVRGGMFDHEIDTHAAPVTADDVRPILQATPLARHPNVGVILATTLGQESHEWSEIESGVFTHELLSGLVGGADVNGDLVIEYSEVQAFVASANRDIKDPRAIPHVIARPPQVDQNAPLIALPALRGTRLVRGDAASLGHFHIELANGQRYLDAHVANGNSVALSIPETGAYLRTDTHEAALPEHGDVALGKLALGDRAAGSRGAIEASYQTALFASGYGRAYYQGYVDSTGLVGVRFPEPALGVAQRAPHDHPVIAYSAAGLAGVAGATAIVTGVLAFRAHADYTSTDLQRPAQDALDRYHRYLPISITSGAVAAAAGIAAWWLWPRSHARVVAALQPGRISLGAELSW